MTNQFKKLSELSPEELKRLKENSQTVEESQDEDPNESDVSEVYFMPKGYPKKTDEKVVDEAKREPDESNLKSALKEFVVALAFGLLLFVIYELIKNFNESFVNIMIAILSIPGAAIGYVLFTRTARIIGHISKSDKLKRMD